MLSVIASIKAGGRKLNSMAELLVEELRELYDMEDRLIDAIPQMIHSANSPHLKEVLENHLDRTREQRERLEEAFRCTGLEPESNTCEGIKGLIEECQIIARTEGDPQVKDAALIAAAQQIEHYEMAAYGAARSFAQQLNRQNVADMLQKTYDEVDQASHELKDVAL
jgi:ferritin-like metal-binding protein YciE